MPTLPTFYDIKETKVNNEVLSEKNTRNKLSQFAMCAVEMLKWPFRYQ